MQMGVVKPSMGRPEDGPKPYSSSAAQLAAMAGSVSTETTSGSRELHMAAGVVNHALQALTSEQMVELLQLLDSDVRAKLERAAATSARKVGEGHKGGEGYKGAGDRRGGGKNGSGRGPGGKAGDWGKIGGGGGKGKGGHSGPVVLNFKPEALPPCTSETSEQVAFQAQIGTPWQLLGPDGSRFKWNLQPREVAQTVPCGLSWRTISLRSYQT